MSEAIFIEILDKAKNNEFNWSKVPSMLEVPEFVDTYQNMFSILSPVNVIDEKVLKINQHFLKKTVIAGVIEFVNNFLNNKNDYAKVAIWKIEKLGFIGPHEDTRPYHNSIKRYIINLNINDRLSKFIVGNNVIDLPIFVPIFFDHKLTHSLENRQNENLYFLQVDIVV